MSLLRRAPSFLNGENTSGRLIKDSRISAARGVGLARNVSGVTGIRALMLAILILVSAACASAPAFSQNKQSVKNMKGALIYIFNTNKVEFKDCDYCHVYSTSLTHSQICNLGHQVDCPNRNITIYLFLEEADLETGSSCNEDHYSGCLSNEKFGNQLDRCDCDQIDWDH